MADTVVIAGSFAQQPGNGGLAWFYLQLLLGFRRLGWQVLLLDRLPPDMPVGEKGDGIAAEGIANERQACSAWFQSVMSDFGFADAFSLDCPSDGSRIVLGQPREAVLRMVREAAFLLNVMGFLQDEEIITAARRRVFLDIDPGFGQMWQALGWHDLFKGHDEFVSLGRNIGRAGCEIPTCGLNWLTMPQPVVLTQWPSQPAHRGVFTSIGAWRGPNAGITYRDTFYGLRAHEFRPLVNLPQLCPEVPFEMALDIHPAEVKDLETLRSNGWRLVDPKSVAGSPGDYRAYIGRSMAEFMVPKNMYVRTNSGLLSDRSVYYLASGKPVLARNTGIDHLYPTGAGLLTFDTVSEAAEGVRQINADYARHAATARRLAEEFFDSDKVLSRLLDDLDVDGPRNIGGGNRQRHCRTSRRR